MMYVPFNQTNNILHFGEKSPQISRPSCFAFFKTKVIQGKNTYCIAILQKDLFVFRKSHDGTRVSEWCFSLGFRVSRMSDSRAFCVLVGSLWVGFFLVTRKKMIGRWCLRGNPKKPFAL